MCKILSWRLDYFVCRSRKHSVAYWPLNVASETLSVVFILRRDALLIDEVQGTIGGQKIGCPCPYMHDGI